MATELEQFTADLTAFGFPTGNIDEMCYAFAQLTGRECPAPEDFGAGDRSQIWSSLAFAQVALTGFGGANSDGGAVIGDMGPVVSVPVLTAPPEAGTGTLCPQVLKNCPDGTTVGYDPRQPGCVYLPCPNSGGSGLKPTTPPPAGFNPMTLLMIALIVYLVVD